jgi:transcriptional regulator GlxA family with amidase domain
MIDVTVVLLDGGFPSTFIAPIEILSSAGVLWAAVHGQAGTPRFRVRTASVDGGAARGPIPIAIESGGPICSVEHADLIVVASIGSDIEGDVRRNAALVPWLQAWRQRGAAIAGICSGVSFLAEAELLDGRPATTHWAVADICRARYPRVRWQPERFVTECDNLFCSGGVYSSIDLSLYLVERFCGHQVATETAKALLLETPRVWQIGYATQPPCATHGDERIRDAQEWLFRNFKHDVQVEHLAARVGMSPRNFARRFKVATGDTPLAYLHRMRINAAKHLLENELMTIQEIVAAVGYCDVSFFRRLFRRYTGAPPRAYRERFSGSARPDIAVAARAPQR